MSVLQFLFLYANLSGVISYISFARQLLHNIHKCIMCVYIYAYCAYTFIQSVCIYTLCIHLCILCSNCLAKKMYAITSDKQVHKQLNWNIIWNEVWNRNNWIAWKKVYAIINWYITCKTEIAIIESTASKKMYAVTFYKLVYHFQNWNIIFGTEIAIIESTAWKKMYAITSYKLVYK